MNTAESILVIFLSTALGIFLVLGIALLVICVQIARHVKKITAKAEAITEKAESVADFVQWAATPMSVGRAISGIFEILRRGKGRK